MDAELEGVPATDELRERLAMAMSALKGSEVIWDEDRSRADAILPLVVAVVAEARTEALRDAESAIIEVAPPLNAELSMRGGDGPFTDKLMESYIEGFHDAHSAVAALRGVGNQKVGVTVDDLALDEMDGNQNAEPETAPVEWGIAWSADHIDTASSWGADEAGARHRVSKYRDYVLVKRLYGQGDDSWVLADQKGTEQ